MFFGFLTTKIYESFVHFCMFSSIWGSFLLPFKLIILNIAPIGIDKLLKINLFNDFREYLIVFTSAEPFSQNLVDLCLYL